MQETARASMLALPSPAAFGTAGTAQTSIGENVDSSRKRDF
jgi:hypothetical protein